MPGPTESYYVHKRNPHKRPTVYTHLPFTKGLLVPTVDCRHAKRVHFTDDETEAKKISCWKTIAGRAGTGSCTLRSPCRFHPLCCLLAGVGGQEGPGPFQQQTGECQMLPLAALPETGVSSSQMPQPLWLAPV